MTVANQAEEILRVAGRPLAAADIARVLYRARPGAPISLMRRVRDTISLLTQAGKLEMVGREDRAAVNGVLHHVPVYRLKA